MEFEMSKLKEKVRDVFVIEDGYLKVKDFLAYGFGGLGQNIVNSLVGGYLLIFYTDVLKVPAAAVGTMFLIAKVWDAINDPIMGTFVDKTRTKWGKMRPYLFTAPIPIAIITIFLFYCPDLSTKGRIVYMYVTYILWGMIYTVGDVPYSGMSAVMTPHPQERANLMTVNNVFTSVGSSIPMILISLLFMLQKKGLFVSVTGSEKNLYFFAGLIMSLIGGALFLFAGFGTREVVPQSDETPSFKENIKYLVTNKYLMLLILSSLLAFPKAIGGVLSIYVAKYVLGSQDLVFVLSIPVAVGSTISMVFIPFLMKKFGAIKTYLYCTLFSFIPMPILYFIGLTFIGKGSVTTLQLIIILIFIAIGSLPNPITTVITSILIADSIDWMECKTGQRNEGISFSIRTFMGKASSALQSKVAAIALIAIHYIQPPKGVDYVAQNVSTIKGLWAWYTILPVVLGLLSVVPLFFYDLKGDKLDTVHDTLRKRREERKASQNNEVVNNI
jgi:sugar (glycoside-pentoside-hexuronide) transporter